MNTFRRGMSGVYYLDPGARVMPPAPPQGAAIVRAPATAGPNGRRMTYEEALAQDILQRNQTRAGTNHALPWQGVIPSNFFTEAGRARVQRPPWLDMPASGQSFSWDHIQGAPPAQVILPVIGAQVVLVQFRVPARNNGVIRLIANELITGTAWQGTGKVIWQILADRVPIQNYEAIVSSFGTTAAPGHTGGPLIISESQLIQLVLNNVSLAPAGQVLQGLLGGYYYPIEAEPDGGAWVN